MTVTERAVIQGVLDDMGAMIHACRYPVTVGSPWPSELAAVVSVARRQAVSTILEGGTYLGQSAWALATFTRATVVTYDVDAAASRAARGRFLREGLAGPGVADQRVVAATADAAVEIPRAAAECARSGRRGGIFLDGPKGTAAIPLVQRLLEEAAESSSLRFVAVHDCYLGRPRRPNPVRPALEELGTYTPGWRVWTTDGAAWAAETDARALDVGLYDLHRPRPNGWGPHAQYIHGVWHSAPSYGPTVLVLEREGEEKA